LNTNFAMEPPLREYFTPSSVMSSEKYGVYTSESALTVALRIIWRNPLRAIWHTSPPQSDFVRGPIVPADGVPTHTSAVKVASGAYDGNLTLLVSPITVQRTVFKALKAQPRTPNNLHRFTPNNLQNNKQGQHHLSRDDADLSDHSPRLSLTAVASSCSEPR
jgi:hypothetical protein